MSMALLATPPLGILISALTRGEQVGPSLLVGTGLVAVGITAAIAARATPS
jgi:drug/metabolite transporter (DMT)-like permease